MKSVPTPSSQPGSVHQRKIHYIDHVLQKRLLVALVLLEIIIVSAAGALLYYRLNAIVEENLYRIHFDSQPSMLSVWLRESLTRNKAPDPGF